MLRGLLPPLLENRLSEILVRQDEATGRMVKFIISHDRQKVSLQHSVTISTDTVRGIDGLWK